MSDDWQSKFKDYTVGGFHINLTPNMIQCLTLIYYLQKGYEWWNISRFISGARALLDRGYVIHTKEGGWKVTRAGCLAIKMLQLADLIKIPSTIKKSA